ncbi:reverse transcriptase domain-containing protein [Tanacetum coccineum]
MEEDYDTICAKSEMGKQKITTLIKRRLKKTLDAGLIYPILTGLWDEPVMCTIRRRLDHKLMKPPDKEHTSHYLHGPSARKIAGNQYYCFQMASRLFSDPNDPIDQDRQPFTCPYGTFAYRRMPFGLCNAPGTFQRCMMAIFHDMIEKTMEVFMDDFSVFGDSFSTCLTHLEKMLKRCEDTNLSLNWEKSHFMVKEGIVLGHKISKSEELLRLIVLKLKLIAKLPHRLTVKCVRIFLWASGAMGKTHAVDTIAQNLDIDVRDKKRSRKSCCSSSFKTGKSSQIICTTFSKLATVDLLGDTMVPITQQERSLIQDSIGPPSTRMPMTLSPVVTFVNVKEKLRNVMRCTKNSIKFAKSWTSGALSLWGQFFPS